MASGVGLMTATHLLVKLAANRANEDDFRRIAECEARLMLAGFGSYHDLRKPGEITKKFVLGIGEKLNNVEVSDGKRIFSELDEQLQIAGFNDPFNDDNIKDIVDTLRPYVARYAGTLNKVSEDTPVHTEVPKKRASTSRVGILTAVNLLYELEMGIISDYDLRQLAEYEKRLKIGKDEKSKASSKMHQETPKVPVEDNQWPPPTLGTVINCLLTELSTKVTKTKDLVTKNLIIEEFELTLRQAGFRSHYGASKIEELMNELEDLNKGRGKLNKETDVDAKGPEISIEITPDVSREVAIKACKIEKKIEKLQKRLKLAGFGEHCSTTQIEELRRELENLRSKDTPKVSSEAVDMTADTTVKTTDMVTVVPQNTYEDMKPEVNLQKRVLGPGYVAASHLLCQLKFGEASEDDRRKLAQYEERLKTAGFGSGVKTEFSKTLGKITNEFIREYKTMLAETSDIGARNQISGEYEKHLKQAGFYEHYSTAQFEAIWTELAKDLKKAKYSTETSKVANDNSKEVAGVTATKMTETNASELGAKNSGQDTVVNKNKITVEKVEDLAGATGPSAPSKNADEVAKEDSNDSAEKRRLMKCSLVEKLFGKHASIENMEQDLPKTGLSAAFHIVLKVKKGQASEDEIKKLRECEEKLMLSEVETNRATTSGPMPALGTITSNLLYKFHAEMEAQSDDREAYNQLFTTYVNKLKLAGFDTISENDELWSQIEFVFGTMYEAIDAPKVVTKEEVQANDETIKAMTAETSKQVPEKDVSEVKEKIVKEKEETSIQNEHLCVHFQAEVEKRNKINDKIIKEESITDVVGKVTAVEKDNATSGRKSNNNAEDEARQSTSAAAGATSRCVKLNSPTKPRDTKASVTNVPMNSKPARKIVVAHRRLKEQAPTDWFSADGSTPPPGFDKLYTSLYSELPLSCRAYAFSTRLKQIKKQLETVNEPMARLLRNQYSVTVESFDRYLGAIQKRASMEPVNNRWARVQPNQEKWRREIVFHLFMSLERMPGGLRIRPLDFSQPLTIRASLIAERLKMVEVKLSKADADEALDLSKLFSEILASFATSWGRPLDCPIPGEPYDDRTSRPLPDELEHLRQEKNHAEKEYKWYPSAVNRVIRDQLTNEFKRQLAIWKASQT